MKVGGIALGSSVATSPGAAVKTPVGAISAAAVSVASPPGVSRTNWAVCCAARKPGSTVGIWSSSTSGMSAALPVSSTTPL